jgi:hypothetical protein
MRRTFAGFVLLALVLTGQAVAGPPELPSGKMTFDVVAEGLRKYRKETDPGKSCRLLERLAPARDPRVGVALGERLMKDRPTNSKFYIRIATAIVEYYPGNGGVKMDATGWSLDEDVWWQKNEADLRRRAARLPR